MIHEFSSKTFAHFNTSLIKSNKAYPYGWMEDIVTLFWQNGKGELNFRFFKAVGDKGGGSPLQYS